MRGSLVRLELESEALKGNPLGDPTRRGCWVYRPLGYESSTRRFPTAYFLHPFMSSGDSWTNASAFSLSVPERVDALIEEGKIPPLLAAFPDGGTALGGTQWINSAGVGRYQDYLVAEVVPLIDRTLRTIAEAGARAVLGRSSGGYGALAVGRDHPEVFGHLAASAGDAYFEYCYLPDFPKAAGAFLRAGGHEPWYRDMVRRARETKLRSDDHAPINILAMAATYSPKAGAPMGLELPFDLQTGRIREDIFARWLEQDPVRFVARAGAGFQKLKTVFLDCGLRDEYNMRWGARMIADELRRQKIDVVHEEFEDGHSGTNYRFDRALTVIAERWKSVEG